MTTKEIGIPALLWCWVLAALLRVLATPLDLMETTGPRLWS